MNSAVILDQGLGLTMWSAGRLESLSAMDKNHSRQIKTESYV